MIHTTSVLSYNINSFNTDSCNLQTEQEEIKRGSNSRSSSVSSLSSIMNSFHLGITAVSIVSKWCLVWVVEVRQYSRFWQDCVAEVARSAAVNKTLSLSLCIPDLSCSTLKIGCHGWHWTGNGNLVWPARLAIVRGSVDYTPLMLGAVSGVYLG